MYEAFTCQPDPKWSAPISQQPPSPQTTLSTSATKHYDAFGNETTSTGTWHGPLQYGGPFGYQTDPDSNLKLLGHRYYDASTGRFLTRDRAQDGRNWYTYGANNPVVRCDPNGQIVQDAGKDIGRIAAERGSAMLGLGEKDCKGWVRWLFIDLMPMPAYGENGEWVLANGYDDFFRARPDQWEEIPNDTIKWRPGDIIVIKRPGKDKNGNPRHGHVQIVGLNGHVYDAAWSEDPSKARNGRNRGRMYDKTGRVVVTNSQDSVSVWRARGAPPGWKPERQFKIPTKA